MQLPGWLVDLLLVSGSSSHRTTVVAGPPRRHFQFTIRVIGSSPGPFGPTEERPSEQLATIMIPHSGVLIRAIEATTFANRAAPEHEAGKTHNGEYYRQIRIRNLDGGFYPLNYQRRKDSGRHGIQGSLKSILGLFGRAAVIPNLIKQ